MGPATSLAGRELGQDFTLKDGWRMYHGETVPGFPSHPHRGFETITIAKEGLIDHSDSLGAAARFGNGDTQWITAGRGIQHSEMFPLLHQEHENPAEMFQIWLNLPQKNKFVKPYFSMLWSEATPVLKIKDKAGRKIVVNVITGELGGLKPLDPPPDSWAADPRNEVAVWTVKMEARAKWTLPKTQSEVNRSLFFYRGETLNIAGQSIPCDSAIRVNSQEDLEIICGEEDGYFLVLQGKPINEPVVSYGPFVMNTQQEIQEAYQDYQRTAFGGWPWPRHDQVHDKSKGRFAIHADGRQELK